MTCHPISTTCQLKPFDAMAGKKILIEVAGTPDYLKLITVK